MSEMRGAGNGGLDIALATAGKIQNAPRYRTFDLFFGSITSLHPRGDAGKGPNMTILQCYEELTKIAPATFLIKTELWKNFSRPPELTYGLSVFVVGDAYCEIFYSPRLSDAFEQAKKFIERGSVPEADKAISSDGMSELGGQLSEIETAISPEQP